MGGSSATPRRGLFNLTPNTRHNRNTAAPEDEQPLRSELFTTEQLEQHAAALANAHEVDPRIGPDRLLGRLERNGAVLRQAYASIVEAVSAGRRLAPADEWLLDNFYLIEEQIRTARRHLPKRYSSELPRLLRGPAQGYPRVYDIVLELIAHVDGRVTEESLTAVVAAYQRVTPLTLGELWAIPIMLRLALIENLRRVAARMTTGRARREQADAWAERLLAAAQEDSKSLVIVMAQMTQSSPAMNGEFAAELARRLQEHSQSMALALLWLEQRLAEQEVTLEQLMQQESQRQAADQVSISNSIGSLRFLSATDWRKFVESLSLVEQILCGYTTKEFDLEISHADHRHVVLSLREHTDVYREMDFATRDRYRHAVERIAKHSRLAQWEVAAAAVRLARQAAQDQGPSDRTAHVGYYLIDQGLPRLEATVAARIPLRQRLRRTGKRLPLALYLGSTAAIALGVTAASEAYAWRLGVSPWVLLAVAPVVLLSASHLGVAIVNWLATLTVTPKPLARMDFSEGIADDCRTLVAIPSMLTSRQEISNLVEALEVRYLANADARLHFALLTDLADAASETTSDDAALVEYAKSEVAALNDRYKEQRGDIFFLFHRPRRWNAQERVWMGYERKRGKLGDLNAFLRGRGRERFSVVVGDTSSLDQVKYVITLDADTQLPRESARKLVATLAHPLNAPRFARDEKSLSDGYCILQPRVALALPAASRSRFVRIFGGEAGIDPYTGVVSDVYQDLFGEGSFIGKGIYEVDAFERLLGCRFPENLILSHDLLEGCHARSALVSDVELIESYPARYSADAGRRHRWIRGDWQIAMWTFPWVPGIAGPLVNNLLSALSRWKILDNLRRSLVPAALVLLLALAWLGAVGPAGFWTCVVLAILFLPVVLRTVVELAKRPADLSRRQHLRDASRSGGRYLAQSVGALAFLVDEAYYSLDAVLRTLVRLTITKRNLLQWSTSTEAEKSLRADLLGVVRAMWIGPALAIVLGVVIELVHPGVFATAVPILLVWLVSPGIAWWLSRPLPPKSAQLEPQDIQFLEEAARKTWHFFETFFGPEDNWLPPDNYQDYPVAVIAHRTSPTNIGLALLSNLAAYDFGFISPGQLIERMSNTFATMERLSRFRGHFFNWYDTRTLEPLVPRYVSTVDSGNLAGHLLTLREGLLQLPDAPIAPPTALGGLRTTLRVLLAAARSAAPAERKSPRNAPDTKQHTIARLEQLESQVAQATAGVEAMTRLLTLVADKQEAVGQLSEHSDEQVRFWAGALQGQAQAWLDELDRLVPLARLPSPSAQADEKALSEPMARLRATIERAATLREVAQLSGELETTFDAILRDGDEHRPWLTELKTKMRESSDAASGRIASLEALAQTCLDMSDAEFDFLFDESRQLLAIGFNVSEQRRDTSFYDLLASEARLASFVAIAQGHLQQEHWFALGRLLTGVEGSPALLSWSGSMFEYLMPLLVMPTFEGTLLDETCKAAVARQIAYADGHHVPWGMSESGYNVTDVHLNYQYRAFGVPGLGFKRGLGDDLVIAPYASMMALMVAPQAACANLRRMTATGIEGRYGYYEAIDYTPTRLGRGQKFAIVRSFMAHHEGMSFLSLAYVLLDRPMQRRFEAYRPFQATELLLHERIPKAGPIYPPAVTKLEAPRVTNGQEVLMRVFNTPQTPLPEVHLLSNGRYHVMINSAGGGYSRWQDLAITRWREDASHDNTGTFCYLRDVKTNEVWSTGFQPTLAAATSYQAIFSQSRAEIRRRDFELEAYTEVTVSPEDDAELRRISITNFSRVRRTVEITSYAEVVLASAAADATHPAFSNLFVQTEIVGIRDAILCTRRPRSAQERPPWMLHLMSAHGTSIGETSYETDRAKFLGRCRDVAHPQALLHHADLSNSQGPVLDPIVAIRRTVSIEPGETAVVDVVTGAAESREGALALAEKYHDRSLADRLLDLAWTHGQVVLRQLGVTEAEAQVYGRLASSIIYSSSLRRASASVLVKNTRGQSSLWGHGISGDLPIVLLRISDPAKIELVRQLVHAHAYWRFKGLATDLVIWNEDQSGYRQSLQDEIIAIVANSTEAHVLDRPGGIFVRRPEQMSDEDRVLMQSVARVVLTDSGGNLADQVERRGRRESPLPALVPTRVRQAEPARAENPARRELNFANGLGGLTPDGREYVITTTFSARTPAPWANVLANAQFGSVVSESSLGYTWFENAHEFRLSPWYDDPITDACGELLYLRDEETGRYWSPTPLPAPGGRPYVTRHGFGYTVFETTADDIASELTVFVALDAPVKIFSLKVRNTSQHSRRLSATFCVEWVLAELRPKSLMHVVCEVDSRTGALVARNAYNSEFPGRVAFLDVNDRERSVTADRAEFFGRNGTAAKPAALARARLSGKAGAGLDPCGAVQSFIELRPGQEREVVFCLGAAANLDAARGLVQRFRGGARQALEAVWEYWKRTLGTVHVETPDRGVDALVNGWLVYQTLACRLWARSGYYQSGGAFGFRDQLQDVMALTHVEPRLAREHLLRAAAHQFVEGDVQHWWHPPNGRGVRTRFSDDFLWLPLATSRYVKQLGDTGVLDERVGFIDGPPVNPDEEGYYDLPARSDQSATLYEHCVRAIDNGLRFGAHGLPLMGCGDWNDGMNLVGLHGKGESVWLAFFLVHVLDEFATIARERGDMPFAEKCAAQAATLKENIEKNAWDGQWYRRAYFDNGEPLGSAGNLECQIDSIPQSWSVLSGAGDPQRARKAMQAVNERLVRRDKGLIQLFDPPFDKSPQDPGYIKGYVPGVRENGGQYTHAAIWNVMAFAALGDRERAWELLSIIQPLHHGATSDAISTYRVEPYVMAADIYAVEPHVGRGGWTWYTGSAGWMYRLIVESLLGLRLEVDKLRFAPCLPNDWQSFKLHYRYRDTFYHVTIINRGGSAVSRVKLDNVEMADRAIHLIDDRQDHVAEVEIGP